MLPRGSATSTGILLGTVEANETSLLSPPEDCQVPEGIRPTFFQAQKHPKESEIVEQVNQFFLEHWPFKTDEHARRFVDEGYAWFACINCPLSLDDRLHWGCHLLTLGFLIDDLLDRMSIEEGVEHNETVIQCACGTILPNRAIPAQWMMYDLFQGMRAVDKPLADELLQTTMEFLRAQVDSARMRPMTLKDYFEYRYADLGKGLLSGIMRFCGNLRMTSEELELVKPAEDIIMKHITFINDICSWEKETLAARYGFELGTICSSVPIMMDFCGINDVKEIKRIMWQMARAWENQYVDNVRGILTENSSSAMRLCLKGLEHQAAGNELWSLVTPRYNRTGQLAFTKGH